MILLSVEPEKIVGVDPGKHSIVYMTNDGATPGKYDGSPFHRLQYTSSQRMFESGASRFAKKTLQLKTDEVQRLEDVLSATNSRSCTLDGFQAYLLARFSVEKALYMHYTDKCFRVMRWHTYRGRQKSEEALIARIGSTFGKDVLLAYGTWNNPNQMRGNVSSPTCGMRRLLSRHFRVVDIWEAYTTKTCSKCSVGTMVPVKTRPIERKRTVNGRKEKVIVNMDVRGLRRCNNEGCAVFFTRDYNAAINIRSNALYYRLRGCWDPKFSSREEISEQKSTGWSADNDHLSVSDFVVGSII